MVVIACAVAVGVHLGIGGSRPVILSIIKAAKCEFCRSELLRVSWSLGPFWTQGGPFQRQCAGPSGL